MTNQHFQALSAAKRRRLIFRAVLRSVLVAVVLVVLYYVLPLDRRWGFGTAIRLLIGILVFVGVMVWQVKAIVGARYSGLRAAEALGLILPLFLVLFASAYFAMERASAASFTEPMTRTDALYFTVTVFSTVGFGDISLQIRDRPGGAHRADARRPRISGRRHTSAPGGRATRPATKPGRGR